MHTLVHQRNMSIHVLAAVGVGLLGSAIPLGLAEKVTLIFCVLLVFFAEILNSALEALVDLAVEQVHEKARITKDAAAAGVLVLAIGTVVIFAALMVHNWETLVERQSEILRQGMWGVPFTFILGTLTLLPRIRTVFSVTLALSAFALWLKMLSFTKSYVFSGMLLGLWALTVAAAWEKRPEASKKKPA